MTDEINRLLNAAANDPELRQKLLNTADGDDPLKDFCDICRDHGYDISVGELFSCGMDMNDSKLRATNGGGSFAIDGWDDAYENILDQLRRMA